MAWGIDVCSSAVQEETSVIKRGQPLRGERPHKDQLKNGGKILKSRGPEMTVPVEEGPKGEKRISFNCGEKEGLNPGAAGSGDKN